MGIDKEQLGINAEISKEFTLSEISKLSDRVDDINIAQKTINNQSIKELLPSPVIFPVTVATTNGTAVNTTINKLITLEDSIDNYDIINIQIGFKTATRNIISKVNTFAVSNIVYNNSDTFNILDLSALFVTFDVHSTLANAFGSMHFLLRGWFKTPTQLYFDTAANPYTVADYNTMMVYSVQGIKTSITIDPVEYVNTTQGIEDVPVGTIIDMIGHQPNHYLAYDNTEYSIQEYPYLAQYIKDIFGSYNFFGGDGINTFCVTNRSVVNDIEDITPIMISNASPPPYIVTASSYYGSVQEPWRAFDKNPATYWLTANHIITGWLTLDFNIKQPISAFQLTAPNSSIADPILMPKDFSLYGSDNNIDFIKIQDFSNQLWTSDQKRTYYLEDIVNYRYYKLDITNNGGSSSYTIVPELRYLLSTASNKYIKYEPTYFMSIEGLIEETTLWEGSQYIECVNGTSVNPSIITGVSLLLVDSVFNYDKIEIHYSWYNKTAETLAIPHKYEMDSNSLYIAPVSDVEFIFNIINRYTMTVTARLSANDTIDFVYGFLDNKIYTAGTGMAFTKVVGIKYKTIQSGN